MATIGGNCIMADGTEYAWLAEYASQPDRAIVKGIRLRCLVESVSAEVDLMVPQGFARGRPTPQLSDAILTWISSYHTCH
jgi:hypothetical protein